MIKLAIVEDEPFFIERLKLILDAQSGYEIMASFGSAEEALTHDSLLEGIEVMLIDIVLPGMSGIELMKEIKRRYPLVEIVAFTGSEDRQTVLDAIRAGASGYMLKGMSPRDIHDSLMSIRDGGSPMSPKIVRALVNEIQASAPSSSPLLSKREREVLSLAAEEISYKDIADKLNISHHTVHTHLKNICEKLGVISRKEAIIVAKRKSLI